MKAFELPPAKSIRAVVTINSFHFHQVASGTFRIDPDGGVQWREGDAYLPSEDLYVPHLDRIAYVVAKVPVEQSAPYTPKPPIFLVLGP